MLPSDSPFQPQCSFYRPTAPKTQQKLTDFRFSLWRRSRRRQLNKDCDGSSLTFTNSVLFSLSYGILPIQNKSETKIVRCGPNAVFDMRLSIQIRSFCARIRIANRAESMRNKYLFCVVNTLNLSDSHPVRFVNGSNETDTWRYDHQTATKTIQLVVRKNIKNDESEL